MLYPLSYGGAIVAHGAVTVSPGPAFIKPRAGRPHAMRDSAEAVAIRDLRARLDAWTR